MRKIDLKPYQYDGIDRDGNERSIAIDIVKNIRGVMLHEVQEHSGASLLDAADLCNKIAAAAKKGEVILEEAEWEALRAGFAKFRGLGESFVELARRVVKAETVDLNAADKPKR